MESVHHALHHSNITFSRRPPPFRSKSNTNIVSVKCSSSSSSPPVTTWHKTLISIVKPAVVAVATTAAILSGRFATNPSSFLSIASPAATESLQEVKERVPVETEESKSKESEALQAQLEAKVQEGKLSDAIPVIDKIIALQPGDKDLLLLKAHLYSHSGDAELAKAVFEEIIQNAPLTAEAYHGLVMIAMQGMEEEGKDVRVLDGVMKRIDAAMKTCKEGNKREELRDFMLLVAQVRVMEGEFEKALGVYRELVSDEPRDFRPYLCQGIVYKLLRKEDEAEKQFQNYRNLVPKDHPYAQHFEENMTMLNAFGPKKENKRSGASKR